jgi:hypothetical protein
MMLTLFSIFYVQIHHTHPNLVILLEYDSTKNKSAENSAHLDRESLR